MHTEIYVEKKLVSSLLFRHKNNIFLPLLAAFSRRRFTVGSYSTQMIFFRAGSLNISLPTFSNCCALNSKTKCIIRPCRYPYFKNPKVVPRKGSLCGRVQSKDLSLPSSIEFCCSSILDALLHIAQLLGGNHRRQRVRGQHPRVPPGPRDTRCHPESSSRHPGRPAALLKRLFAAGVGDLHFERKAPDPARGARFPHPGEPGESLWRGQSLPTRSEAAWGGSKSPPCLYGTLK